MLWQSRRGPLLPAHHPGTPVAVNRCRRQSRRETAPTGPPFWNALGCYNRVSADHAAAKRAAPTGPPSWNAPLYNRGPDQSRREPLLPAHHPGTPRRLQVSGPTVAKRDRSYRPTILERRGSEVCADKRGRGPPLPAHHSGTPRGNGLCIGVYSPASAKRTAPTGPPSWNADCASGPTKRRQGAPLPVHHPGNAKSASDNAARLT